MKLCIIFLAVGCCIPATLGTDIEGILQRLEKFEHKANEYELEIAKLTSQIHRQDDVIADLQKDNAQTTTYTAALTERVQVLENQSGYDVLRQKRFVVDPEVPVAFHAVMSGGEHPHFGRDQRIVFDTQLLNVGDGYNRLNGLFTAPAKGIYVFSLSVMGFNMNGHVEVAATIMANGHATARSYAHGDSGRHDQGAVTVTVQLEAGDQVYVENYVLNDVSLYGDNYSSFTGCLLVPM